MADEQANSQRANLFEMSDYRLHVSYSTTSLAGKPQLVYQDARQTLTFSGDEIRSVETAAGNITSVVLQRVLDAETTSFALLVPRVHVSLGQAVNVRTLGITTVHRFLLLPVFDRGQLDTYRVSELQGTATFVAS
jgi:hypothetical protein